jgi:hypothetical protein
MRIRTFVPLSMGLAAALVAAGPARAQAVHGRVTEAGTGLPVPGAVVMLLDAAGARVTAAVSTAQGEYALRAAAPGAYTLRAERVGFAAAVSPALPLAAGADPEQALEMQPRLVTLEPLLVTGTQRACTIRPQAEAAVVWDELRMALDAAAVADEHGGHAFRKRYVQRERSLLHRQIIESRQWTTPGFGTEPFHATPVDRLAQHGYMEVTAADSMIFHAPDAHTLLSDAFLDQHCFRLRERRGSVGLEFAPTADRTLPDVRGVLWMDRRTARLRSLEYTYVNLPYGNPADALGGEMEFEQLPDGGWIVRRWIVRMPRLRITENGTTYISRLVEQGGEVIDIRTSPQ